MRKIVKHSLLALSLAMAALPVHAAQYGVIRFEGEIVEGACSVDGNSSALVVPMGNIAAHQLRGGVGTRSAESKFEIVLTGCKTDVMRTATFSFESPHGSGNLLRLDGGSSAQGVAIGVRPANGASEVEFGGKGIDYMLVDGDNRIPFHAYYVATDERITAGKAHAKATFNVSYW